MANTSQQYTESNAATLQRIVATLLSLAMLAGRVSALPHPVRLLVLLILRPAERCARDYVLDEACACRLRLVPMAIFAERKENSRAEAMRMADSFRAIVWAIEQIARLRRAGGFYANTVSGLDHSLTHAGDLGRHIGVISRRLRLVALLTPGDRARIPKA